MCKAQLAQDTLRTNQSIQKHMERIAQCGYPVKELILKIMFMLLEIAVNLEKTLKLSVMQIHTHTYIYMIK